MKFFRKVLTNIIRDLAGGMPPGQIILGAEIGVKEMFASNFVLHQGGIWCHQK